jgi:FlaA1/EpsC-like NDP-sugar epimerase
MPSAPGHVLRDLVAEASRAGLPVQTLPSLAELMRPTVEVADIRPITEADLLGRRQIDTDVAAIAGYVRGRRVLVTGAGGSIGSELCRQLCRFEPLQLVMLDRDESALHAVQLSIEGRALLDDPNLVVADIRDEARLHEVFERHQPQVVFHAAALKHLPLLEQHPSEGVKTNIWGTQHVLRAARSVGVSRFVNISTDKAANPVSVLGLTKRVAERLTSAAAQQTGEPYLSVRFGNVLGSRGSVVPAFQTMIEAGGPVTVTDERVTRFFMTIPEAVQLVIQAGAIGAGGEVLILDMGEPVRIADIARRLIEASGKDVQIVYTGLRPGEKLHEDLVGHSEVGVQRNHPMITHAVVPPLAAWDLSREAMGLAELRSLAETSAPADVERARPDARGLAGFGARRSERRRRV